ncbi:COX15/CtaA family protein [Algibacillus agarilyticus]|uniref:COX15/CtaA family protein n=1 Tax=Algibacillus agarilyticus TaxID=2234133 RepID=UPI000DD0E5E7|nr:COX15/CtaA family protein [Algibacillus agarilyticus]
MKKLVAFSLVLTLIVVILGAFTRLTDAGLGCPDWPGCYGMLTVPKPADMAQAQQAFPERKIEVNKAWNEMIHRYVAGTLGLFILAIAIWAWRLRKYRKHTALLLAVVIFQAALGMWTVTLNLMPVVVMGHLAGGFSIFCLLALLWFRLNAFEIKLFSPPSPPKIKYLKLGAITVLAVLVIQILLGGWTSSNYAALVCTDLPICQGDWLQQLKPAQAFSLISPVAESYEYGVLDYAARLTIHVSHRVWAIITSVAVIVFLILQYRWLSSVVIKKLTLITSVLLVTQVALGVSNILFTLPLAVAVSHNAFALLLLTSLVFSFYLLNAGFKGESNQQGVEHA